MERIALFGVGSLGTIIGAHLSQGGVAIDLVDSYEAHVKALNEKGARVIGQKEMLEPVTALLPEQVTGQYDLIFLTTKQTTNPEVFAVIDRVKKPTTVICTLQNGLPEIPLVDHYGEKQVMGAPVGWGATWVEPGVSRLTTEVASMTFTLGTVNGEETPELKKVKAILEHVGEVTTSNNLMGLRWSKLFVNATFSGLSTALGCLFGDILLMPERLSVLAEIGKEVIDVAKASGIHLEPGFDNYDLDKSFNYHNEAEKKVAMANYHDFIAPHVTLKASMFQDIEKGRKTEVDAINGVVCEVGRKFNISTPANDKVREIIKNIEAGKAVGQLNNINLFK